jgi:hypothetical protein
MIMTDIELDSVYTQLCKTMTNLGEEKASLYLARFALLAINKIDNAQIALGLVEEASADLANQ